MLTITLVSIILLQIVQEMVLNFRWAAQGMEFLIAAIDPINLEQISGEEFQVNFFQDNTICYKVCGF